MRAVRIARSVGRPSRLKKPPGIFPAAYMRSSTSTVSGKKSVPSRGSMRPCAVARTIVSPELTTTAPSACFASLPVSNVISWSPISTETVATLSCVMLLMCPPLFVESGGLSQRRWSRSSLKLPPSGSELAPEAQLLDQFSVPLHVFLLEIVQEAATAPDELEQPAARVVVLRVRAEVLGQLVDALREHRDLHLGRARVVPRPPMAADDLQLCFLGQGQTFLLRRSPQSKPAAGSAAHGRDCGRAPE